MDRAADGGEDTGPEPVFPANDRPGGLLRRIVAVPLAYALGGSNAELRNFAGLRLIHPREGQCKGVPGCPRSAGHRTPQTTTPHTQIAPAVNHAGDTPTHRL
ncbi:hypothetical protein Sviol_02740 [Streptomyces violascens]|uniref:Uncharacterized protein n=1 Tax=Streptomyces violascens TaxID=67381 RepID=A0ABQ3QF03_9ACTN|nr:hypothetical protein Sviol_02740 [Streptomyces violascens]